ncbi:MAG: proteasome subunit alpha [Rhodococcus sp.]|uniref:proteasome subunit alpha n=1 Tax=Rhodococcus TaxID=1827 RepID=UPI00168F358A|nr:MULTISPECIES: proteasome subunit alpha [Rhodococcus]NLV79485.1 proteasome subunit alpha [Rhodococcus sp. (in: high G+C Gram-positive bacteria)]
MTLPYYASAEQIMRDRSELARKGIARGRSVIAAVYEDGVLFVAENPSKALHKISELYDRLGFAAVGKYNEFENLRRWGIMHADMRGYSYDRRDVTGRSVANAYAQLLGTIFTDQAKPYEVELCVAEVGRVVDDEAAQLYRITYDGSIVDEPQFVVMGGNTEPILAALRESYRPQLDLASAVATAVAALQQGTVGGSAAADAAPRVLGRRELEVAVLERSRPRRAFRRITGAALDALLPAAATGTSTPAGADQGSGEPEQGESGQ